MLHSEPIVGMLLICGTGGVCNVLVPGNLSSGFSFYRFLATTGFASLGT